MIFLELKTMEKKKTKQNEMQTFRNGLYKCLQRIIATSNEQENN